MPKDIPVAEQLKHMDKIIRIVQELEQRWEMHPDRDHTRFMLAEEEPIWDQEFRPDIEALEEQHLDRMWGNIESASDWRIEAIRERIWGFYDLPDVLHELRLVCGRIERGEGDSDSRAGDIAANDRNEAQDGTEATEQREDSDGESMADRTEGESPAQVSPPGELSNPRTKKEFMRALGLPAGAYKTFNAFAERHGIRQAGNRQLWQLRLDGMDAATRAKIEAL